MQTKKINVMMLASSCGVGGFEKKLDILARNFDKSRFKVTVLLVYPDYKAKYEPDTIREEHRELLKDHGDNVETIEIVMSNRFDGMIIFKVAKILKKYQTDILYFLAMGAATFIAPPAGKLARVSAIVRASDTIVEGLYPNALRKLDQLMLSMTDRVLVPSSFLSHLLQKVLKISSQKIEIIPNAIDLDQYAHNPKKTDIRKELGLPSNAKLVGMVAVFTPAKSHEMLFEAVPHILKKEPDTYFLLIGDGILKEQFVQMSQDMNLTDHILFLGYRHDVGQILPNFDVGILCSNVEVHPLALIEMMASGIPVVATEVGGIPEIVNNGKDGFLIPFADASKFADAICTILGDKALSRKLGQEAKKRVLETFALERMMQATQTSFENLSQLNDK